VLPRISMLLVDFGLRLDMLNLDSKFEHEIFFFEGYVLFLSAA
jgi:hypothetical protein